MKKGIETKLLLGSPRCDPKMIDLADTSLWEEFVRDATDEFYNAPAPSEDIWKKFELLPTPPRSPNRNEPSAFGPEHLNLVSDLLDFEDNVSVLPWPGKLFAGLKWELLHDCMWSGQCTDSCKKQLDKESVVHNIFPTFPTLTVADVSAVLPVADIASTEVSIESVGASPANCGGVLVSPLPESSLCFSPVPLPSVDPSSVLPYTPLSDHSYHQAAAIRPAQNAGPARTPAVKVEPESAKKNPIQRTIVLSDTPSDSDDEIDVVTVTSSAPPQKTVPPIVVKTVPQPATTKPKQGRGRPSKVVLTVAEVPEVQATQDLWTTNLLTPVPSGNEERTRGRKRYASNEQPTSKKYRRFKKSRLYSGNTSRSSSDSEDCEKRSMHNSMERKRRDDLRFAFQTLRLTVPDLQDKPKAPKVMILNKAAMYAKQLTHTSSVLERTLHEEAVRRSELQRRLQQLQRSN